jgi:hypothetical protein
VVRRAVITVAVPALAAAVPGIWGRGWNVGGEYACASGSYFLADLGWAVDGLLIALMLGIAAVVTLAVAVGGLQAFASTVATFALIGAAGHLSAASSAEAAGCAGEADGYLLPLIFAATISGTVAYLFVLLGRVLVNRVDQRQADRGGPGSSAA